MADTRRQEAALLRKRAGLQSQLAEIDLTLATLRDASDDAPRQAIETGQAMVPRREMLRRLGRSQSWVERAYRLGFPRGLRIAGSKALSYDWPAIEAWMRQHARPGRGIAVIHERAGD